jgi:hypothetical protein
LDFYDPLRRRSSLPAFPKPQSFYRLVERVALDRTQLPLADPSFRGVDNCFIKSSLAIARASG